MPPVIVPPSENGSEAYLLALFRQTELKLIREIARKRGQGYVDYAEVAALERVRKTLQRMTGDAEKYVPLMIEHEFYQGKEAAAGYANAQAMINPGRSRAIEILTDNLLGQVEEMAQTAYQATASKLFLIGRLESDPFRETVIEKAAESLAEGRGSLSKTEEIIRAVQEQGITAFVDKAGHEWSLSSYGNMAVRTTVRQAQVASVLTEDDHDLYKILAIGSTCPICAVYEGRVYSKSGTSTFYPPLSDAFGKIDPAGANDLSNSFLNIHPNCLHTLVPYTEKGKTPKQVEKERRFSNPQTNPYNHDPRSKKQKAAYEEKERNRAIYRNNVKQYQKYLQAGVPGMPKTFQTFQKHKRLDDEKYKDWMREYRKAVKPTATPAATPVMQYKRFDSGEAANEYFGQRPPRSLRRENREEYDRRRSEYESSAFGTWSNSLTTDEQASIGNYSGDAYSGINGLLRKQMTEKMVNAWDANERLGVRDMVSNLDSAIGRFELKDPIRVYRTCERDVLESLKAQPGATFRDNGYVSTSALSKKVASGNVVMEIDVPPGTGHGAWINPLSGAEDEEYEFLMPRGSEFKVMGVSERDGDTVVHLEFIGSQKQPIEYATREEVIDRWKRLGIYDEDNAKKI